ncbi:MAG: aminodeoxychorismate/anthranilate synthase component II [Lachnospiraceae bacterium]|jgi:anthranilate synthase component 2|nr:aminodeoxychorismate/anthranilate synthase component II [Lachnospiraceae bacterium]MDD3615936.1 aminodeoxychorismate/anthranilate synthase component II [Lachnospiraceae bacterium]
MILLIDNYDSFSYNLYQMIGKFNPDIKVIRNDEYTVEEIAAMKPEKIILSPGPGTPDDAGVCIEVIQKLGKDFPILGVCLGHQSIYQAFGGCVTNAKRLMHGKQSMMKITADSVLFENLPKEFKVGRYHSLAGTKESLPEELEIIAVSEDDDEIMAVGHKEYRIYGLQFHPESILTPDGEKILENFVKRA